LDDAAAASYVYLQAMPNHRSVLPDGLFHVFARSIPERPLYADDTDRTLFLLLLGQATKERNWTMHAYCLMTTHYHLVLHAKRDDLSRGMQRVHSIFAARTNKRHGRHGHVLAERFTSQVIDSEEYLFDACAYVLQNPVKARLCDRASDWPWSWARWGLDVV
jgi:putative transposase